MSGCKASVSYRPSIGRRSPSHEARTCQAGAAYTSRRLFSLFLPPVCVSGAIFTSGNLNKLNALWVAEAKTYDPLSKSERELSDATSRRIFQAIELLERGRKLQAQGDFQNALISFTTVIEGYNDFALSEYARLGRALALYEVGDREEAIAELEDVSISLKGYPEVHAALAAVLYADRHAPLLAENQFTIATLLDRHYTELSYVKETKHWPPSLVTSMEHFLNLS